HRNLEPLRLDLSFDREIVGMRGPEWIDPLREGERKSAQVIGRMRLAEVLEEDRRPRDRLSGARFLEDERDVRFRERLLEDPQTVRHVAREDAPGGKVRVDAEASVQPGSASRKGVVAG